MLIKCWVLAVLTAVTLAACAAEGPVDSSLEPLSPELAGLINTIEATLGQANVAGAGLAIVSRDAVVFTGGLGVRSRQSREPATSDTLFRLGSITKSFVGLTALRMRRDRPGLFTRPVNQVVPELLGSKFGGDRVTLAHLLEHTAGLSDLSAREFAFQGEQVTFAEAVQYDPSTRQLRWPAAAHSSYSNAGYGFAGYVMETLAGRRFETLVEDHVLIPLGMKDAGFFVTDASAPLAAGYNTDGVTPIPYWHMLYRSFGGLNATPQDMARFVQALLQPAGNDQVFQSAKERQRFENPVTTLAAGTGLDYGYGLGNYHWFSHGLRFHGHGGDADGYLSHYGYSTEAGYGYFIVITAFNKKPLNRIRDAVERYLAAQPALGDAAPAATAVAPVTLSSSVLSQYAGHYVEVTRRFGPLASAAEPALQVVVRNDKLETRYRGNRRTLVALSPTHFKRPWQPDATYAFITLDNGDVYLQGDLGNFRKVSAAPSKEQQRKDP